ncbi:hypothetical protein DQ384_38220 [Sphaerisporangium album]|uniref:Uncharacterized protein n=1 Tax=Sphaerisporangium album TaxID=509200 RepID=A0A367ELX8_9ACTN|nr:hypothetical protein [Sphaerisporangium album]RCG19118.1 hypothetical protein DQ384_38220 [Sphaerisporangium album]
MRVPLPDDQWAEILEPSDLRAGDLKAVHRAVPIGARSAAFLDEMDCVMLRRVITAWSLELPLPKDLPGDADTGEPGSLDKITIPQYRALVAAIAPHMALIHEDPASDPKPSSESAGTSPGSPSTSAST